MNLKFDIINPCLFPLRRFSKEIADSDLTWYEISAVRDKPLVGRSALYSGGWHNIFWVRNLVINLAFSGLRIWKIYKYCLQIEHKFFYYIISNSLLVVKFRLVRVMFFGIIHSFHFIELNFPFITPTNATYANKI